MTLQGPRQPHLILIKAMKENRFTPQNRINTTFVQSNFAPIIN